MEQPNVFQSSHLNPINTGRGSGTSSPAYRNLSESQQEDVLDQSSSMEQIVSSLLNESVESNTSGPATSQLLASPSQHIDNNFQRMLMSDPLEQRIGGEVPGLIPRGPLKDGWMKYPIKSHVPMSRRDNLQIFPAGDGQHSSGSGPECSSYADVARGSSSTTAQATLSSPMPTGLNHRTFQPQPKMVFENFVELGRPSAAQEPRNLPTPRNFPFPQNLPGSRLDVNGFNNIHPTSMSNGRFPGSKDQHPLQSGYKFERGSGDVGFNPYLMQPRNGFHKSGIDPQLQTYGRSAAPHNDPRSKQQYDLQQLYRQNLPLAQNAPLSQSLPFPQSNPYNNINQLYQGSGHKAVPSWCKPNGVAPSNAMLYQASGITGLSPVIPSSDMVNAQKGQIAGFLPSADKDQMGVTLEGSLRGCFSELQILEDERKKHEMVLSQKFKGKRISSSNGIAITPLPPDPLPVDHLIADMYKEYSRVVTLTSKIGGLTRGGLSANMERMIDRWSEKIQTVDAHRKAELSHTLRKLSPETVKQLYSPGNNLIAKLSELDQGTRDVRTYLWLSTVHVLHIAGPFSDKDD